ncbi:MAG: hypothetical protein ACRC0G_01150 [Fusobacteriaceae bacterium]
MSNDKKIKSRRGLEYVGKVDLSSQSLFKKSLLDIEGSLMANNFYVSDIQDTYIYKENGVVKSFPYKLDMSLTEKNNLINISNSYENGFCVLETSIGNKKERLHVKYKNKDKYYSENPTTIFNFKRHCQRANKHVNDYNRIDSGRRTFDKNGRKKETLYFHVKKR